ncbi:hypothetical protein AAFC00_006494 [Neodothiora populina]|uniref:Exocyst complex component Sec6 n=1 Tax=Neodothiora populina TaxID=2781224 RepID=A0ABR3P5D6_9PEZI
MNETEDVTSKLAELLRHPDDLGRISSLQSEFARKKAAVDGQLRVGLQEQLSITQSGMSAISEGQRTVQLIKEEMMKIDRLCVEAQNMIRDFPFVDKIARMQANFAQVEEMTASIEAFEQGLDDLEQLLREDDQDMEHQNNLLAIHYGLTKLRDVRDKAMDQIKNEDSSLELINNLQLENGATLQDLFARLDEVVDWFDEHVGTACMNLIPLVQSGNNGMVVRLALIVEEEEKKDRQVKALQDAQREFKDLASRFKQMNSMGQKELRGYKEKFLEAIRLNAEAQFDATGQAFLEDPEKLEKSVRWYFNDLNTVKLGMQNLMPKKWRILTTYVNIYHKLMHDFLISRVDDPELNPPHMLAIVHWVAKYYAKMDKLGVPASDLNPHLIDDREVDLVREYKNLITKAVDQWMDRIAATDKQSFVERKENTLDTDPEGHFRTKTLGDMWRMFREQLDVAASSQRPDVVEGVVDAMINTLKGRQDMWKSLAESETHKFTMVLPNSPNPNEMHDPAQSIQSLQDWLVALANDQIACIDDHEEAGQVSYLTSFRREYEPLVTPAYALTVNIEVESLSNSYVDLGTYCISLFVNLIFVDFRPVMAQFFTPSWYTQKGMAQIIATFEDYLTDYTHVLHPSLRDVLVEELADELLVRYLAAMRNKSVKFRRNDPFTEKIKDDILTAFEFFKTYETSFPTIKDKFRAVNSMVSLLSAEKGPGSSEYGFISEAYADFKRQNWDLQIGWVEAVLRTRDDFDRGMLNAVKGKAAEMSANADFGEREERMGALGGGETVMGKVR